jgi:hypothetical protein
MVSEEPTAIGRIIIRIITSTSVSLFILIFSGFSVYIQYNFVTEPKLPKLVMIEGEGFSKPSHSALTLL